MGALPNTLVNGIMPSWNETDVQVDGISFKPYFKELKFGEEVSAAHQYGASQRPIGTTSGQWKPSCSFVMFDAAWKAMRDGPLGGDGWSQRFITITYSWGPRPGVPTSTVVIVGRVIKCEGGGSAGDDALEASCEMICTKMLQDGKDMLGVQVPS